METTNLSKIRRDKMLNTIDEIKKNITDEKILTNLSMIENELTKKKYGLIWEEHEERVDKELETQIPTFEEIKDKEIVSNPDKKFNFLLEGDNLHSLYLLEKTHKEKIDIIYIDPPYNTGNKDFSYNDHYVDFEDGYRHSKWLSFMEKRIKIAKELLNEKGSIFIQIDDNELSQLKLLCDNIFGEENFINIISVNMKNIAGASGGGEDKRFKKNCEYILIYAKNYQLMPLYNGAYEYTEISELIQKYLTSGISWKYTSVLVEEGQKKYIRSITDGNGNEIKIYKRINPVIKSVKQVATDNNISEIEAYKKFGSKIFRTTNAQSSIRTRIIKAKQSFGINDNVISIEYIPKTGKNKGIVYEQFYKDDKCNLFVWLKDTTEEINGNLYKKDLQGTYWDFNAKMKNLTKEGNIVFPNGKKPIDLIKRIISLYPSNDCTVLDFFAGSGTTGHAVISLNNDDFGTRNYILCTNNENDICENITYKRLENVIKGYKNDKGKKYEGLGSNLKYYRCTYIPRINTETENLHNNLLINIKNLIQLENGIEIDDNKIRVYLNEDELDRFSTNEKELEICEKIYISSDILLTSEQENIFENNNIEVYIIPEYYFEDEIMEVM
ncbi:MAG: site-specific DNA-methyltransferase [Bacilli bacterium]|nr:site-specific DNA-methyltransferase [Bacilli bacterium]